MKCKDCHQPIHWSRENETWYHDALTDVLTCPGTGWLVQPEPIGA